MRIQQDRCPTLSDTPLNSSSPAAADTTPADNRHETCRQLFRDRPELGSLLDDAQPWDDDKRQLLEQAIRALPQDILPSLGLALRDADDVAAGALSPDEPHAGREVLCSLLTPVCANTLEDGQLDRALAHLQTLFSTLAAVDENDADLFYDALTPEEMQISQQAGLPGLAPMKTPQAVASRAAPDDDLALLKKTVEDFAWRVCARSAGNCLKQLAADTHFEALVGQAPQLVNVVRELVRDRDTLTLAEMAQRIGQALGDWQGDPAVQDAREALHTIAALLTTADALRSGRDTAPALIPSLEALTTLNRSPLASQCLAPATRENVALALDVAATLLNTLADINPAGGNFSLTDAVGAIASSGVLEKIAAQAAPEQRWLAGAAEKLAQLYGAQAMNALLMPEASLTQQLSGLLALAQESGLDRDILDHVDRRLAPALSAARSTGLSTPCATPRS
ncbi:hypothetical protein OB934_21660 [Aeromonas salmonicida]|uniref:hypothetical protein n=1 Tax=Aeromonas salmonicida TaxID=645 RepID=UPI00259F1BBC|nr:hypothetical protein [Aeromonas salmonicida]MDM5065381.1 hypothetical protein [Aeromonas salmonicida]